MLAKLNKLHWITIVLLVATLGVWIAYFVKKENLFEIKAAQTSVTISKKIQNLGNFKLHNKAAGHFVLINSGDEPLEITNVKTDCQCTSPDWSKEPVAPKDSVVITLIYNSESIGTFQKKAYVYGNIEDSPLLLVIRGTIED